MTDAPSRPQYGFQSVEAEQFPPIIVLENTTVCNLRCVHCPHGQGYTDMPEYKAVHMDWDVYKKTIDEIASHKITVLRMSPAGEALIHAQFLDQVRYAKEKGVRPINLTTNGLTLDNPAFENGKKVPGKTLLDRLIELDIDIIDISLDAATRQKYEKIRVGSNYHRVWSNLHRLLYLRERKRASTKVMISIIQQPDAMDEVDQFVKYWTPYVDRVLVRPFLENLGLTPEAKSLGVKDRWPCPQFWKRVTISADGSIRFCVVDWLDKSAVGNIKETTIQAVWKSAEYERLRGCHLRGAFGEAHSICAPCTDWMGMKWDWGYEVAVGAVMQTSRSG